MRKSATGAARNVAPIAVCLVLATGLWLVGAAPSAHGQASAPAGTESDTVAAGRYLFHAAGCAACHTDVDGGGAPLAGGRPLATPFGTFYSPNITPDPATGIGAWSESDFLDAVRAGRRPDGQQYYPVFPYPSYAGMRADDARKLFAFLRSLAPVVAPNRDHELPWYMRWRMVNRVWNLLFGAEGVFQPDPIRAAPLDRGAYLVEVLGHCGECHTPRNIFGALDRSRHLAGNPDGPDGDAVPDITPNEADGIGSWSRGDVVEYLASGMLPDGDFAGGAMVEVIDEATSHLTSADREAIADYLRAVPVSGH